MFDPRPSALAPATPVVRGRAWFAAAAAVCAVVFGAQFTLAYLEQTEENRRVAVEMRDTLSAAEAALESKGALPARALALPAGSSDVAKAGAAAKNMLNRTLAQRQAYERELEAAGWMRILDGTRIAKDSSLDESRAILQRAKTIVAKYRDGADELIAASRREIDAIDMSAKMRKSMQDGFDRAAPARKQQEAQLWSLEEQIVAEMEKVIALLGAKKKSWRVEGGEITFTRRAELDAFDAHMSRVQSIVAQQEQMQRASIEKAQATLKQLAQ